MNTDKKSKLLAVLENRDSKQFHDKYYVIETFVGTVEKEVEIFSLDTNGYENWYGEYNYEIYERGTDVIVYDGYFMDEEELIRELQEELELVMNKEREEF